MDKRNKQLVPETDEDDDIISSVDTVASGTECTGLIPTPPETEAEAEAYASLYTIPRPKSDPEKKKAQQESKGTS